MSETANIYTDIEIICYNTRI